MGNTPSSSSQQHHQQQQQLPNQARITPSAPPTPTGVHHLTHQSSQPASHPILLPPPTNTFVDGGYLFPLSNVYPSSAQDWLHPVVQNLILSRRLAPFYRGLEDWEPDWDKQTVSHALQSITFSRINAIKQIQKLERQQALDQSHQSKNHPSHSITKRFSTKLSGDHHSPPSCSNSPSDLPSNPRQLIFEAVLNSQIRSNEVDRYLPQTIECPICFLYYPPNINLSRCCQQPICTECFTQIKRIDPTPQEIKSEPACCPYCVEAHFGVTYEPPPLDKRTDSPSAPNPANTTSVPTAVPLATSTSAPNRSTMSSQSVPTPNPLTANLEANPTESDSIDTPKMKRRQTTSHTSKQVVTTDSIQPDWQAKLEAVKAAVQRRANRRIIFRQEGDRLIPVGITSSRDPSGSAFLAAFEQEHSNPSSLSRRGLSALMGGSSGASTQSSGSGHGTIRRSRTENSSYGVDLEELMIMEAMRLSLVEEEERKRKAAEEEEKLKNMTQALNDDQSTGRTTQQPGASSSATRIVTGVGGGCGGADDGADQFSSSPTNEPQDTEMFHSLSSNSNLSVGLTSLVPTPTPTGRLNHLLSNSELEESSDLLPEPIQHETTRHQSGQDTHMSGSPDLMMDPDPKLTEGSSLPKEGRAPFSLVNPPSPSFLSSSPSSSSKPNLDFHLQTTAAPAPDHNPNNPFLPPKPGPIDAHQLTTDPPSSSSHHENSPTNLRSDRGLDPSSSSDPTLHFSS